MKPAKDDSQNLIHDDDWSHVRETINMLYLAVCQIETTMSDSNDSVNTLTKSFTELASHTTDVSEQVQKLTKPEELQHFKTDISDTAAEMNDNISASIHAFQFYDRVCQRLDHVSQSLEKVSLVMENNERINNVSEWRKIQNEIKESYTMEAERIMFEHIMRGRSVKEALEVYRHHFENGNYKDSNSDSDEIELF